jgi:hypothetical protein
MASNGGCCVDPLFTDMSAEDVVLCNDRNSPWCSFEYHGQLIETPRDYAMGILDSSLNNDAFYKCQTRRFYSFVVGSEQGEIGLQASNGVLPDDPGTVTVEKYRSSFEHSEWSVLELLRQLFKGDEFLCAQAGCEAG